MHFQISWIFLVWWLDIFYMGKWLSIHKKIFIRFNQLKFLASTLNASNKLQNLLKILKPKGTWHEQETNRSKQYASHQIGKKDNLATLFYNVGLPSKLEIIERQFVQHHGPHTHMVCISNCVVTSVTTCWRKDGLMILVDTSYVKCR
jgi:hypothetical protein